MLLSLPLLPYVSPGLHLHGHYISSISGQAILSLNPLLLNLFEAGLVTDDELMYGVIAD